MAKGLFAQALSVAMVVSMFALGAAAAPQLNTSKGEVVEKDDTSITIRDEKGERATFSVERIDGKPDAKAVEAIAQTKLHSTVKIDWARRQILAGITTLAPPPAKPASESGTFVGLVKERSSLFVIVQGGDGDPVKFSVGVTRAGRRSRPEPDAKMQEKISDIRVGDRVFVKWEVDGQSKQVLSELRPAKSSEKTTYPKRDAKAAEAAAVPTESGVSVGKVEAKTDSSVKIKLPDGKIELFVAQMLPAENGKPSRLDPDILKIIKYIGMDATLQINWTLQEKIKRITAIKTVPRGTSQPIEDAEKPAAPGTGGETIAKPPVDFKEGDQGTFTGRVLDRGTGSVQIMTDEDAPRKLTFYPKWVGKGSDEGGGLDQVMQRTMGNLKIGQMVKVRWVYEEKLRAEAILLLGARAEDPKAAGAKSGTANGKVIAKGEAFIVIRTLGEEARELRLMPKWRSDGGGEFDREMIAIIRATPVGTAVTVQWEDDGERVRVVKLTKMRE